MPKEATYSFPSSYTYQRAARVCPSHDYGKDTIITDKTQTVTDEYRHFPVMWKTVWSSLRTNHPSTHRNWQHYPLLTLQHVLVVTLLHTRSPQTSIRAKLFDGEWGRTRWCRWLRHCATGRFRFPMVSLEFLT